MGLDLAKLEKVRQRGPHIIARCPACAEAGGDHKGEHLFINDMGHFGCVLYPGQDGQQHRQRIFELAGTKEIAGKGFEVRRPLSISSRPSVIQEDILGHLGHFKSNHARKDLYNPKKANKHRLEEGLEDSDPSVPDPEQECLDEIGPRPF